jgi:hypothetical protein
VFDIQLERIDLHVLNIVDVRPGEIRVDGAGWAHTDEVNRFDRGWWACPTGRMRLTARSDAVHDRHFGGWPNVPNTPRRATS